MCACVWVCVCVCVRACVRVRVSVCVSERESEREARGAEQRSGVKGPPSKVQARRAEGAPTAVGRHLAHNHPEERCLAGAVAADDAHDRACGPGGAGGREGLCAAVMQAQRRHRPGLVLAPVRRPLPPFLSPSARSHTCQPMHTTMTPREPTRRDAQVEAAHHQTTPPHPSQKPNPTPTKRAPEAYRAGRRGRVRPPAAAPHASPIPKHTFIATQPASIWWLRVGAHQVGRRGLGRPPAAAPQRPWTAPAPRPPCRPGGGPQGW